MIVSRTEAMDRDTDQRITVSETSIAGVHGNKRIRPGDWLYREKEQERVGRLVAVVLTTDGERKARSSDGVRTHVSALRDITGYAPRDEDEPEPTGDPDF